MPVSSGGTSPARGLAASSLASVLAKKRRLLEKLQEQLAWLSVQATDKEENKQVALSTSKLNYLDPRISIAWYVCLWPSGRPGFSRSLCSVPALLLSPGVSAGPPCDRDP